MIKDLWQECNLLQKIVIIFCGLLYISYHVLAIYGLLDVEWVASDILLRILLIVLFALCIASDTMMIILSFIDKD